MTCCALHLRQSVKMVAREDARRHGAKDADGRGALARAGGVLGYGTSGVSATGAARETT